MKNKIQQAVENIKSLEMLKSLCRNVGDSPELVVVGGFALADLNNFFTPEGKEFYEFIRANWSEANEAVDGIIREAEDLGIEISGCGNCPACRASAYEKEQKIKNYSRIN